MIELKVSQYRYFSEDSWGTWFYEVAPFVDEKLDAKSLMIGHLNDSLSLDQCVDEIQKQGYKLINSIVPSDTNYNTGRKTGIHLDYHSFPLQVKEASPEDLGKLAQLLLDTPFS